jgi:hypothetical protein
MSYLAAQSPLRPVRPMLGWTDEELWGTGYKAPETYKDPLERWVASWWTPQVSMVLMVVGGALLFWPYQSQQKK